MARNKLGPGDLAKALGITPVAVGRYLRRARKPRGTVMDRIHEISGGKVTANDFYHPSPKRSA